MVGVVGNLAFNTKGVPGPGVEDPVPCGVEVELPICNWEEGL